MKKKSLYFVLALVLCFCLQGCFFDGFDDSAYGVYFLILPFFFLVGSVIFGISLIFVKKKKSRIASALICYSPCIIIYILSEIHYFPGYIESLKRERVYQQVKNNPIYEYNIFPNIEDNEIILLSKKNRYPKDNVLVLKQNSETGEWEDNYSIEINDPLLPNNWHLIYPQAGNSKYFVAGFEDANRKVNHRYFLALFVKNEKWQLVDVIEKPMNTATFSLIISEDTLVATTTLFNIKSEVSVYKLSEDGINLVQKILVADKSRNNWTYSTCSYFYNDQLVIADKDFISNNGKIWSDDFNGCGKLTFYSLKDGSYQETQTITYEEISCGTKDKSYVRGLGHKVEPAGDDYLIVSDTSGQKFALKKINSKWEYNEKYLVEAEIANQYNFGSEKFNVEKELQGYFEKKSAVKK
ncbi:hypothetical protein [Treponema sp.]|uniref:hypothetical protein n=1 Tax=Treponema sp. TaxID=166 RepID=UPI00298D638B|nr:hypothetical protein [Treponema sp.]MCR5613914.1 hypothetical protein [Treponema sp.]